MCSHEFIASLRVAADDQDEARQRAERFVSEISVHPEFTLTLGPPTQGLAVGEDAAGFALAAFPRFPDDSTGDAIAEAFEPTLARCLIAAAEEVERWMPPQRHVDEGEVPTAIELVLTWHGGIEVGRGRAGISNDGDGR